MLVKLPPILPEGDFVPPTDLSNTDDPSVRYTRSYLLIRAVIGLLGAALPVVFFIGEFFMARDVHFRGSISAYYHSPMRDVFIGGLCVIGFLLIMYLSGGQGSDGRLDRPLSTVAGISLLGVAFLPTNRPGLAEGAPRCGQTVDPPPLCSAVQQRFGETLVATFHYIAAALFILSLALICFYWAARDAKKRELKAEARGRPESWRKLVRGGRSAVYLMCGAVIVFGAVWAVLPIDIWQFRPLYVGEVISVWAFGFAWLFSSRRLWQELLPRHPVAPN